MSQVPAADFRQLDALEYAGGRPAISAWLKTDFQDFKVDEELGFVPTGSGEHLYLHVRKTDYTTTQAARRLAEVTGVPLRDVGYSGMKDRRGECTQWFSLKLPPADESSLQHFEDAGIQVLKSQRNKKKLRVGSHKANRFRLRLRHCQGEQAEFEQRLARISKEGVPNYFGEQRFGKKLSNIHQVLALNDAAGQPKASADNDSARPQMGRQRRGMLYSAGRAYLFNQVLSQRLALQQWNQYVPGDVLNLDGTQRYFAVAPEEWDDTLQARLASFDIHPTGPLPGLVLATDKYVPQAQSADIEEAVLANYATLVAGLIKQGLEAARRPLRFQAIDLQWRWSTGEGLQEQLNDGREGSRDENPGESLDESQYESPATDEKILELSFQLPRGAYATSLLRELCIAHEPNRKSSH